VSKTYRKCVHDINGLRLKDSLFTRSKCRWGDNIEY